MWTISILFLCTLLKYRKYPAVSRDTTLNPIMPATGFVPKMPYMAVPATAVAMPCTKEPVPSLKWLTSSACGFLRFEILMITVATYDKNPIIAKVTARASRGFAVPVLIPMIIMNDVIASPST